MIESLLIVDDDRVLRERLARALRERGYDVRTADGYDAAIESAREESPELALIDLRMPGKGGLALLQALLEIDPSTRVVVLTGYGSIATAVEAMRMGAVHYLSKPADADDVVAAFAGRAPASDEVRAPSLARVEWEHIQRVMVDCGQNVSEAARRLGVHRRSLQRKLLKNPARE